MTIAEKYTDFNRIVLNIISRAAKKDRLFTRHESEARIAIRSNPVSIFDKIKDDLISNASIIKSRNEKNAKMLASKKQSSDIIKILSIVDGLNNEEKDEYWTDVHKLLNIAIDILVI